MILNRGNSVFQCVDRGIQYRACAFNGSLQRRILCVGISLCICDCLIELAHFLGQFFCADLIIERCFHGVYCGFKRINGILQCLFVALVVGELCIDSGIICVDSITEIKFGGKTAVCIPTDQNLARKYGCRGCNGFATQNSLGFTAQCAIVKGNGVLFGISKRGAIGDNSFAAVSKGCLCHVLFPDFTGRKRCTGRNGSIANRFSCVDRLCGSFYPISHQGISSILGDREQNYFICLRHPEDIILPLTVHQHGIFNIDVVSKGYRYGIATL